VRADDREIGAVDLRRDQRAIRRALFDSVPRTRRLRARLMPPSTGRFFAGVSADVADAVRGWFGGLGRRAAVAAGRRDR
jgi:hypothetical protein